jgi:hypothetical protein
MTVGLSSRMESLSFADTLLQKDKILRADPPDRRVGAETSAMGRGLRLLYSRNKPFV